jgi:P27 family predicted phage terminase small subunit
MGKRGFPAKPIAIRMAEGTYRPDRHGNAMAPSGRPSKPKRLTGAAGAHWRRVLDRLEIIGVLAKTDVQAIARYCETLAEYDAAMIDLAKFGRIQLIKNDLGRIKCIIQSPCVGIVNKLRAELRRMEAEYLDEKPDPGLVCNNEGIDPG